MTLPTVTEPSPTQPPQETTARRRPGTWFWVGLVMVAGVVWNGSQRTPSDSARPVVREALRTGAPTPLGETFRVVSFNIHGGKGLDRQVDLPRVAAVIGDCDLAGLYEVRSSAWSRSPHQAAELGQVLNMDAAFAPTERYWWHDHFGNALLMKPELQTIQKLPLPGTRGKAFRNVIIAQIPWQSETLNVLAVHVDREQDRLTHLDLVIPLFRALQPPAILMGDLNADAGEPPIAALVADPDIGSPLHDVLGDSLLPGNIDWIFTRGLETVTAELIENDASDHPAVSATLRRALPTGDSGEHQR